VISMGQVGARGAYLLAIPSKGRLVEPTLNLLSNMGIKLVSADERSLVVQTSWPDLNVVRLRPEDIPSIVETGAAIMGITGLDYVVESDMFKGSEEEYFEGTKQIHMH